MITAGFLNRVRKFDSCRGHYYCSIRVVKVPYGSFNLANYGGFIVTTSLLTGQVAELHVGDLHRLWTAKVAPAAR